MGMKSLLGPLPKISRKIVKTREVEPWLKRLRPRLTQDSRTDIQIGKETHISKIETVRMSRGS
jgi:hypothetical protein